MPDGWEKHEELVLHELKRQSGEINDLRREIGKLREEIGKTRVQAAMIAGGLAVIPAVLVAVLQRLMVK